MACDPRYEVLFEPVRIGPVTSPNRFYQVPHCSGMGYSKPNSVAAMRETKAEGGWGVVCTEYCSIHPSSDDSPLPSHSIWDEKDIRSHARMVENVHRHGSLAGVELWHGGGATPNIYSREEPIGPSSRGDWRTDPIQCRVMDKRDIRNLRRWHVDAALRAKTAGFDIIYVYATHDFLLAQFLNPENKRSDEYGGSIENRVRIVKEIIEETKEAVGETCAVAVRFSADVGVWDGPPDNEEPRAMLELLAELPDLWDINARSYAFEIGSSRFVKEASLEKYVSWVKQVTSKPVVSVGRFTSPDTMVRQVRQGVMDLIGAARPSIADPFLPRKLAEGREEDIRECIGCNICSAHDRIGVPIRCTQNPAIGEEWRRGWHPEYIEPKASDSTILVVGGGPAGLEAARALGQRGYAVTLAEARTELGGRVSREAAMPTLAEWGRVRDWRVTQINKLPNVEIFLDSRLDAAQILEFGADRVALATGATWRRSGIGMWHAEAVPGSEADHVLTPDDVMDGARPTGRVVVFDDDHYYMGSVVAEALRLGGAEVTVLTPGNEISSWAFNTDEQPYTQSWLLKNGVQIETGLSVDAIEKGCVRVSCVYTGNEREIEADHVVMVTGRSANEALYAELSEQIDITRIGDCSAPGMIAAAVMAGHRYAREMDTVPEDVPFRRDDAEIRD
jgi:dimethylamine/trimethylamine dehydrogenase